MALVALLLLAAWTALRLVLSLWTGLADAPLTTWPRIFVLGLAHDLVVLGFALPPLLLYEALLPDRWRQHAWHRRARWLWLWLLLAATLFGVLAEAVFWNEFSARFNFIAVDYLVYTHEVIGNIRQSYPLAWLFAAIALLASALLFMLRSTWSAAIGRALGRNRRLAYLFAMFALPAAAWVGSELLANVQGRNARVEELSGNGLYGFFAAFRHEELDYHRYYRSLPAGQVQAILRRLRIAPARFGGEPLPTGAALPAPLRARPRNIVLISVESLSADFLDSYGAHSGLTPHLDELVRTGFHYTRVFATGTRTVRGLEALSLGTPPLPGRSLIRHPGNTDLATIGNLLRQRGFATWFVYGGYGYFDNMNAYFAANGYSVFDRTDIPDANIPHETVWGVADEALFDSALPLIEHEQQAGKPFFVHIMTTSNHRPYTYPDGRIDIPSPGGRAGAVKYTDYAIGRFIDAARSKPWFAQTLFVIVADHDASVAGRIALPVARYRIPLIFYAPGLIESGHDDRLASQIDIVPTLLDALGIDAQERFMGWSLLRTQAPQQRALIGNYQSLGYLKDDVLTVLLPRQRVEAWRIDPDTFAASATNVDPRLRDEAIAIYQGASDAYHAGRLRLHGNATMPPCPAPCSNTAAPAPSPRLKTGA